MQIIDVQRKRVAAGGALASLTATAALLWPDAAHAGGTIGWAEAVGEFADEGVEVGQAAVVLGIIAVGAILMFGITGLLTTLVMFCLGGALIGGAEQVGTTLFEGGGGGGSIYRTAGPDVAEAARHGAATTAARDGAPLDARAVATAG